MNLLIKPLINFHQDVWLDKFYQLDKKYFPLPWEEKEWTDSWKNLEYSIVAAELAGELNGFCLVLIQPLESVAHILKIVTVPNLRRQGIGRQMLQSLCQYLAKENPHVQSLFLEVQVDNKPAIELYKDNKFSFLVEVKNFYRNGQSAWRMEKRLS